MISCRQRRDTERALTLRSLAAVGLVPRVHESPCDPPHPRENRRISLEALQAARGSDLLFVEDDIDADGTLPAWIDRARALRQPVTFCTVRAHMQPAHVNAALRQRRAIPTGLYPVTLTGWYGTQAVYLPADLVTWAADHPAFMEMNMHLGQLTWTGFDLFLREHLPRTSWRMHGAFPNPVQHRDPPKMVPRAAPPPPRVSLTYGHRAAQPLPRVGDERRVDVLATSRHYADHLRPIWDALPPDMRGTWHDSAAGMTPSHRPTIVSAYGDLAAARRRARPVILTEHGAGQTYRNSAGQLLMHPSYAGGRSRAGCILLLTPGPAATSAYHESGTQLPVVEVGCPKLDAWHDGTQQPTLTDPPTIAVSFHWDCAVAPETRSAWARYLPAFAALHRHGYRILGHAHPRIADQLRPMYAAAGIPYADDFDTVMRTASVYACDNSSTMYEFASTGRPVIVLNHRIYRRDVQHGLRFWQASRLGPHADREHDVEPAVRAALRDTPAAQRDRRASVLMAYAATDGQAAQRAADAIVAAVTG